MCFSHSVGLTDRKETQNSLKGNCGSVRFSAASAGLKAHCNLIHMHLYAKAALQTAAGFHVTLQNSFLTSVNFICKIPSGRPSAKIIQLQNPEQVHLLVMVQI